MHGGQIKVPGRLGSSADAVVDPAAVEAAASAGEENAAAGKDTESFLSGELCSDRNGRFVSVAGTASSASGAVGIFASYEGGGTVPSPETEKRFLESFPDGILMVVDVYSCTVAFYRKSGEGLAPASVLMKE